MILLFVLVFFPALGLLACLAEAWASDREAAKRHRRWKESQRKQRER